MKTRNAVRRQGAFLQWTCWAVLCAALAACNPEPVALTTPACPDSVCNAAAKYHLYAGALGSPEPYVWAFGVDGDTGRLTSLSGNPTLALGAAGNLMSMTVHPNGRHLFATDQANPANVLSFPIAADGSLGTPSRNTLTTPVTQARPVVSPTGEYLYVLGAASVDNLNVFQIATDGTLTQVGGGPQSTATAEMPKGLVMHPDNAYAFVAHPEFTEVYAVQSDGIILGTGTIASSSDKNINGVAMDPQGLFVAAGQVATDARLDLLRFTASPLALTLAANLPVVCPIFSSYVPMFDPNGNFVYVGCSPGGLAYSVVVDRAFNTLGTSSGAFPTVGSVDEPGQMAMTPDGKFAFYYGVELNGYAIDTATGIYTGAVPGGPFTAPGYSLSKPIAVR